MASMWPLLKRDGQGVQYAALLILWNMLIGYKPFTLSRRSYLKLLSTVRRGSYRNLCTSLTVLCLGCLFRVRRPSCRRTSLFAARSPPRHFLCAQCTRQHPSFCACLALEYQTRRRS